MARDARPVGARRLLASGIRLLAVGLVIVGTGLGAAVPRLSGQESGGVGFAASLARADELYFAGRPHDALVELEGTLARTPEAYRALWRASRAALARGLLQETVEEQNRWYRRGAAYGRRAVALRPSDGLEGRYWLAANAGLHAIQAGEPGEIAELAEEVHRETTFVLEREPDHAGAHNVLGQLHFEIMKLSAVERWLGRLLLGGDALAIASWEGAERHLARAARLEPSMIRYRLDLARLHLHRDRPRPAVEHLRAALRLEPRHPPDPRFQNRARELLERARSEVAEPDAAAGDRGPPLPDRGEPGPG